MKNLIPLFVALVTLTSGLSAKPIICVNGLNDAYVFATTCPPVSNPSVSDVTEKQPQLPGNLVVTKHSGSIWLWKEIPPVRRFRMTRGC